MNGSLRLISTSLCLSLLLFLTAPVVFGQEGKGEGQLRTVHGVVMDKAETPIASCIVFLKNTRSNAIRSYITDDAGNYRFSGLDPNTDYEVHAEKEGSKSQTRTVSSFDTKKEIVLNFKIEKKKT